MSVFKVSFSWRQGVTAPTSKHDATETFRISSGKVPRIMHYGTMWRWWVDRFTLCENTAWYPQRWSGWGSVQIKILIMLQIWKQSAQCFWTAQCTQLQCVYTVKTERNASQTTNNTSFTPCTRHKESTQGNIRFFIYSIQYKLDTFPQSDMKQQRTILPSYLPHW